MLLNRLVLLRSLLLHILCQSYVVAMRAALMSCIPCASAERGGSGPAEAGGRQTHQTERGGAAETQTDGGAENGGGETERHAQESDRWTGERRVETHTHTAWVYSTLCSVLGVTPRFVWTV